MMKRCHYVSPAWTSGKAHNDGFINRGSSGITVDLDILVGVNN